ncbi:MAG TPA: hypothetical protein VK699_18775 [Terriglobales bacterium]|jgi:hypothetical protein|nr:hypothetical protein [Terriglobales bacterium]
MSDKSGKNNRGENARVTNPEKLAPGEYFVRLGLANPYAKRKHDAASENLAPETGPAFSCRSKPRLARLARLLPFL